MSWECSIRLLAVGGTYYYRNFMRKFSFKFVFSNACQHFILGTDIKKRIFKICVVPKHQKNDESLQSK